MYDSIRINGVSSDTVAGLAVVSVDLPLLQTVEYEISSIPGLLASVRSGAGQVKPVEISIDVAVLGSDTEAILARWKAVARYFAGGQVLQISDLPNCYYTGYVKSIKKSDETAVWIRGIVTFVANPPCACHNLGSHMIPVPDIPIPEQLTDENITCKKTFSSGGTMPAVSENGAYLPAVYLAVTGSFTRLVLGGSGGITINYTAHDETVYVDTERMLTYRIDNGSRVSLSAQTSGSYETVAKTAAALPVSGSGLNIAVRMLVTERG